MGSGGFTGSRCGSDLETASYSNTNGSPSVNRPDATITLTKPIEPKGWRSTSVTRSRKPTPEFMRRGGGEEDRGSSKPSAGGDALTLSLETVGHAADPLPHLLVGNGCRVVTSRFAVRRVR